MTWGDDRGWRTATVALIVTAFAIGMVTFRDYGATWDEEHSLRQGDLVIRWYASGFRDTRAIDEGNFRWYGGFFNVLVQLVHSLGTPPYETSHFLSFLFGVMGLALAYNVGSAMGSRFGGYVSTLFLWITPIYYGHSFNNPKDLPFAVMVLASMAVLIHAWSQRPNLRPHVWIGTGLVLGLTLAIRVGGVIVLGGGGWLVVAWLVTARRADPRQPLLPSVTALLLTAGKIVAVAWVVMLIFWPYAQTGPIRNPWRTLLASAHFEDWIHPVRFNGADVLSNALPWTYIPLWLAEVLPEFYLVALVLAVLQLPRIVRDYRGKCLQRDAVACVLVAGTIMLPVAMAVLSHAVLYNGIRHVLFIVPLLAVLAGTSASAYLVRARGSSRIIVAGLLAVSMLGTAIDMMRLHPYQSLYFNRLIAGGLPKAAPRFETDYWGQSYKEGVEWLVRHYHPETTEPVRVANCSTPFLTGYYLTRSFLDARTRFVSVKPDERPDVVLATTRWLCYDPTRSRLLHVVTRMGVPLTYVAEVRAPRSGGSQ